MSISNLKDEDEPCIEQESDSLPDVRNTPERQILSADSLLISSTSPPMGTYHCNCRKPTEQFFGENENSLPRNVGKYTYKCADNDCHGWKVRRCTTTNRDKKTETRIQRRWAWDVEFDMGLLVHGTCCPVDREEGPEAVEYWTNGLFF